MSSSIFNLDILEPTITREAAPTDVRLSEDGSILARSYEYQRDDPKPRTLYREREVAEVAGLPKGCELFSDGVSWKITYTGPNNSFHQTTFPYTIWETAAEATLARKSVGMTQDQLAELAGTTRVTIARHEQPSARTPYRCTPGEGFALMLARDAFLEAVLSTVETVLKTTGTVYDEEHNVAVVGLVGYASDGELIAAHPELADAAWPSVETSLAIVSEVRRRLMDTYLGAKTKADGDVPGIRVVVKSPLEWQCIDGESDLRVDCALPHLTRTDVEVALRQRQEMIANYVRSLNENVSQKEVDARDAK